ncbi:MAG: putative mRNA 3-end processing factor [Myxococcota bacterium]|jgi:putative mRNA 3-end processing factor
MARHPIKGWETPLSSDLSIVHDQGVHLEGTILWFDPVKLRDFGLVSSARAHLGDRQQKVLMSDRTGRLLALRHKRKARGLVCPFYRPFSLGNLTIELFPSGYMAGASSFQVTLPDDEVLVYAGPFSRVRNRTAERYEVRNCDTLILDANYGHEVFKFPKRDVVERQVAEWAKSVLEAGSTPVFLVASPGKAQDLSNVLAAASLPLRVHRMIYAYNKAYRGVGLDIPLSKQFRGHPAHGEVLIWPSHLRKSPAIRNLRKARFAAMTGAAFVPGIERRLKVNKVFPWSARAGYDDLLAYVKEAKPGHIITTGRHAETFAETLRAKRFSARALVQTSQLELI